VAELGIDGSGQESKTFRGSMRRMSESPDLDAAIAASHGIAARPLSSNIASALAHLSREVGRMKKTYRQRLDTTTKLGNHDHRRERASASDELRQS
jgi:hypothetical protein